MRTKLVRLAILVCATLALMGRAYAVEPALQALEHKGLDKKVLIITDYSIADIQKLTTFDAKNWTICDIQCEPEKLTPDMVSALLAWVQAGGSLWYQDCRMAQSFGMEAAPLSKNEVFKSEVYKDHYNTHSKIEGLACIGYPVENNDPLLTDVDAVVGFLIPVGKDQYGPLYSAVKAGGDTIGLLRASMTAEADDAYKMIAAYKHLGSGTIVFKPLVFQESLASDRFQVNLREWANGYPVPTIADIGAGSEEGDPDQVISSQPRGPVGDTITLATGEVLHGQVQNQSFRCIELDEMSTGEDVQRKLILSIDLGSTDGVLHLRNGKTMSGLVDFGDLELDLLVKMPDGSTRHIQKTDIKHIEFGDAHG